MRPNLIRAASRAASTASPKMPTTATGGHSARSDPSAMQAPSSVPRTAMMTEPDVDPALRRRRRATRPRRGRNRAQDRR